MVQSDVRSLYRQTLERDRPGGKPPPPVGLTEPQARVLAAAIPDLEPLRVEMDHLRMALRSEMDRHFAGLERRLNAQTRAIVGTLVAIGGILVATNLLA